MNSTYSFNHNSLYTGPNDLNLIPLERLDRATIFMKTTEPRNAKNQTKLLAQVGSQNCPELGYPEAAGHKLTRPVLEKWA